MKTYRKIPEAVAQLTPEQNRATQEDGTERADSEEKLGATRRLLA
ncbi:hypothetical protein [Devosia nitrariae]|nr:hypothetical protein [Devosia nitrariae]